MANYLNLDAARLCVIGKVVSTGAQTWPQGGPGTSTLFTVHGGSVFVTMFCGLVTTVPGGDPGITLGTAPTVGTAETNGLATTVAITEEAGTWITLIDTSATQKPGAMSIGGHAGNVQYNAPAGFPVAAGTITLTAANAETGAINWYLAYVPLDEGAYVRELTN